jgi:serine/threonine protein kinase
LAFIIQARIGRGRTVETFQGRLEVGTETLDVVVKRPRSEFAHNEAFLAALVEWANKQKEVEHEQVVAVLEAGRTDTAYVIQERVIGASLAQVLDALKKRKRTMMLPFALHIAEQVAGALSHLHDKKIVHGGLDPNEILISYDGDVKLGDQDLHRLDVYCAADLGGAQPRGQSVAYRAPELAAEKARPTFSSDTYAFALIVLEMLIGHPVWSSANMTVEASVSALKDFTHLGQAQGELTLHLAEILLLCAQADPINRVPSGRELSAGLRRIIAKHQITADKKALGTFVKALIPKPRAEEAPTEMHDPARLEKIAKESEGVSVIEVDSGSVPVDPDVEKKALLRTTQRAPSAKVAPPDPKAALASDAGPPHDEPPSALAEISKVAAAAALASAQTSEKRARWQLYAGFSIVALILGLMIVHMATRGGTVRIVQITATSIPPGASVFLDNQPVGTTPLETSFAVAHGKLKLRFELEGHETYEALVETKEDALRYEAVMRPLGSPAQE